MAFAAKRVSHLLKQTSGSLAIDSVDVNLFTEDAERDLLQHIKKTEQHLQPLYVQAQYDEILNLLATLHDPVNLFFRQSDGNGRQFSDSR